jgi:hypothetical protein
MMAHVLLDAVEKIPGEEVDLGGGTVALDSEDDFVEDLPVASGRPGDTSLPEPGGRVADAFDDEFTLLEEGFVLVEVELVADLAEVIRQDGLDGVAILSSPGGGDSLGGVGFLPLIPHSPDSAFPEYLFAGMYLWTFSGAPSDSKNAAASSYAHTCAPIQSWAASGMACFSTSSLADSARKSFGAGIGEQGAAAATGGAFFFAGVFFFDDILLWG